MKKSILWFSLLLMTTALTAQERYGHINLGELVSMMPETNQAEQQLRAYRDSLVTVGEQMAKDFQADVTVFSKAVREGNLTRVAQENQQAALQQRQEDIRQYEQDMVDSVSIRRDELLGPVLSRAEIAIKKIAQSEGFNMIFDTSGFNMLLFAADSEDIMAAVMAALGIEPTKAEPEEKE